jgi:hypothetical protein
VQQQGFQQGEGVKQDFQTRLEAFIKRISALYLIEFFSQAHCSVAAGQILKINGHGILQCSCSGWHWRPMYWIFNRLGSAERGQQLSLEVHVQ